MDITEVLELADALIFTKTGKHLDHLQKAVLEGTFQGQTYVEIAEENYQSEGHVRNTGSELWKILSEQLKQEINKSNFRAIINKKVEFNHNAGHVTVNNLNFCTESKQTATSNQETQKKPTQQHLNLSDAPEILSFYGRENELATLQNWILEKHSRLIAILGLRGIGKTALAIQLIEQIKPQFDYIIYRSLRFSPTPEITLSNLLQIFSPPEIPNTLETQLSQLLDYLRKYRCLIILDDVQMLFTGKQLAGYYQADCENYQHFFKLIAEVSHNSCLILNSSEKPREIAKFEQENKPCHSLILGGLYVPAQEILQSQNLTDEESWETLIDIYQGNPLWLQLTGSIIKDLCGGSVANFLQYEMPILSASLQTLLDGQFQRLTVLETAVITVIAGEVEPISLLEILKKIEISIQELFKVMESLKSRFLVEGIERDKTTFFVVNQVIKEYIKTRHSF